VQAEVMQQVERGMREQSRSPKPDEPEPISLS
jgi:hypothetical protein